MDINIIEEIDAKYIEYLRLCREEISKQGDTLEEMLANKTIVGETEKMSRQYKKKIFQDTFNSSYEKYLQYLKKKLTEIIERYEESEKRNLEMQLIIGDIEDIDLAELIILAAEKMDILVPVNIFEQIFFRGKYRESCANEFIGKVWNGLDDYTIYCLHDFRISYLGLLQSSTLNRVADFVTYEYLSEEEQEYVKRLAADGERIIKDVHECTKKNF